MRTHPAERRVGPGLYEIEKIKRSLLSPCQAMWASSSVPAERLQSVARWN